MSVKILFAGELELWFIRRGELFNNYYKGENP